jgi:integrase
MARPPTGQVVEREGKHGTTYAIRFRAFNKRQYVTLDPAVVTTREQAKEELADTLVLVKKGLWRPPVDDAPAAAPAELPTFHAFASEWLEMRTKEDLSPKTIADYKWALELHLLPWFGRLRLDAITAREVDRYKVAKAGEGALQPNQINKTLTRLSQILAYAVEYEILSANPAAGRRRRLKRTVPARPWVEPEQLPSLLHVTDGMARALIAVLAGAGLRINEALSLRWENVDTGTGVLYVGHSKTEAGVREVHLTPAVREELVMWRADAKHAAADALVFGTAKGTPYTYSNARRRLFMPAIDRANVQLGKVGIRPIGKIGFHSLRRTYASLRCACGDDVAYTSAQIGHTDARFTLRVYTQATNRRERLSGAHLRAYDRAIEWARMGTNGADALVVPDFNDAAAVEETAS